ncbi:hypothetical protein [Legionella brunensis]|uniref:Uncharacterized protein n=1 Tax=Legionella brunensis TaxID=29422 RepID=A0A0W0SDE2_9GAMM|nr:hypothetical protein [Legionella brunensis]KTC81392.1 hypothetical protein Lbru_1912 [Legionella brunensis]
MRTRVNSRQHNLATVSSDKAAEDAFYTQGLFSLYSFFDKEMRKQHKIKANENNRWLYDKNDAAVPKKFYMYAIGKNGALYIGNPTVHSQFKAGKETQSAGWIDYQWNEEKQEVTLIIDNCSGHYTPTLSQFLSGLHGLHEAKMLPDRFTIRLSKLTKFDYSMDADFWENARLDSPSTEKSAMVTVTYSAKNKGFIFSRETGQSYEMSKEQIFENDSPNLTPNLS